jgi:hypothetical protein
MTQVRERDFREICYRVYVLLLLKREKIEYKSNFHCQIGNGTQGLQFKSNAQSKPPLNVISPSLSPKLSGES